jgi:uncharacterized protein (TIGR00255 family)
MTLSQYPGRATGATVAASSHSPANKPLMLKSMTGFARTDGTVGTLSWTWEVRTVNGRGLDPRIRLAQGFDVLEPRVREAIGRKLSRGSVAVNLMVTRCSSGTEVRLNETILTQVLAAVEKVRSRLGPTAPASTAESILQVRGVLETVEYTETEEQAQTTHAALLKSLDDALDGVVSARAAEGTRLAEVMLEQLSEIERIAKTVANLPSRHPSVVSRRLEEQLARLLHAGPQLDATRLHQEAALLATKFDIEEELRRLQVHVAAARDHFVAPEPVGRKLDFLTQEFNREANTLCAKSNDSDVTRLGLALKAVIDQLREQVQNIE